MKTLGAATCILWAGITCAQALTPDMTVDFSWIGTRLCSPTPVSPEFLVQHAPEGTHRLRFALTNSAGRELGGAEVALPAGGAIAKGTVSFRPPCVGGMYTWTVDALDAGGKVLGSAKLTRPFF
ncbi:hypothetical protein ABLE93_01190 [Xanthobacter sp. KR7-65]|uniref:hypothetical protein n=1 Tax=Xanthobacter sp. KR7-65 TaxID=3156612 RepID=UPI0032B5C4E7